MDEYVYIGKIVNTHGIKGELRLLSDFKYKDRVFLEGRRIYIGEAKTEEVINSYRHHKVFDMITLKGYTNINEVLKYLKQEVYVKRYDLSLDTDDYLDSDLIGLNVLLDNGEKGTVLAITNNGGSNKTLELLINGKKVMIPYHKDFIKKISLDEKLIELNTIEGLI